MAYLTVICVMFMCSVSSVVYGAMMCGKLPKGISMIDNKPKTGGQRIVGGSLAQPGSHPWIVSLKKKNGRVHHCGGALVRVSKLEKTDIVITAAHCVYDKKAGKPKPMNEETVTAGTNILYPTADKSSQAVQTVKVKSAIYHGLYPTTKVNDIAILVLETPINFTEMIQPACLPESGDQVQANTELTVAGWGVTDEKDTVSSKLLLQVGVPAVNQSYCEKQLVGNKINECMMLCAGHEKGGKDACRGDSGGPLVENKKDTYVLQGVVSFGIGCAQPGKPGVFTRVSSYINWIYKKIKENSMVHKSDVAMGKIGLENGKYESGNGKLKSCDRDMTGVFQPDVEDRRDKKARRV